MKRASKVKTYMHKILTAHPLFPLVLHNHGRFYMNIIIPVYQLYDSRLDLSCSPVININKIYVLVHVNDCVSCTFIILDKSPASANSNTITSCGQLKKKKKTRLFESLVIELGKIRYCTAIVIWFSTFFFYKTKIARQLPLVLHKWVLVLVSCAQILLSERNNQLRAANYKFCCCTGRTKKESI